MGRLPATRRAQGNDHSVEARERKSRVKILRLKTAVVEGNFDWTFVRIETDEGIRGLGSVSSLPASLRFCGLSSPFCWAKTPATFIVCFANYSLQLLAQVR